MSEYVRSLHTLKTAYAAIECWHMVRVITDLINEELAYARAKAKR